MSFTSLLIKHKQYLVAEVDMLLGSTEPNGILAWSRRAVDFAHIQLHILYKWLRSKHEYSQVQHYGAMSNCVIDVLLKLKSSVTREIQYNVVNEYSLIRSTPCEWRIHRYVRLWSTSV